MGMRKMCDFFTFKTVTVTICLAAFSYTNSCVESGSKTRSNK